MLCGRRVRVRVRVSRSCVTENTHTPSRLEALRELSIVIILSHFHESPNFRTVVGVLFGEIFLPTNLVFNAMTWCS